MAKYLSCWKTNIGMDQHQNLTLLNSLLKLVGSMAK